MLDRHQIKTLRERRGLTLDQCAKAAGMYGRQHWYSIESGRIKDPSVSIVAKMAAVLGVTVDELLRR
jgi:transcriptional regulator with XRE-family HTH domain